MLTDIERKVLRILWNFNAGRGRMPTLHELSVKTGKNEPEIERIMQRLADQFYIEWDGYDTRTVKIVFGWERDKPKGYSRFL